ncbi:HNH endonuclease [Aliikangiella sp. G2MR2-5]|uniref:HNH endonuclease n=1 Tax=Aliikangiella sp. G2MR2-5 TaxID=2788943 RepID=UPI0018A93668|nr:HNH endonuclease [Aliikangiella sp. G2MR2-5]
MDIKILKLNKAGQPLSWIDYEQAALLYSRDQVAWTFGDVSVRLRGGYSRLTGKQSTLEISSVIAVKGISKFNRRVPPLTNRALFARDQFMCTYCGRVFPASELTRDHIMPRARGGRDRWSEVTTACRSCNNRKGCRTPEEAGMKLLCIPYVPNKNDYLVLQNRRVLADQLEFLKKGFSKHMKASY